MPARSRFGNAVSRLSYTLVTGLRIHDTQSGLRAFTADLIPELLTISGERYEYEMNVLLRCANRQIPIRELKIETIYWNNNAGSHFHPLRDSCLVYRELLAFLSDVLSVNRYAAKICTELLFFFGSWIIQRCVIFRPASRAVNRAGGE